MPSNEIHDWLAELLLRVKDKRKVRRVNRVVDFGWDVFGKKHRRVWGHDPVSLLMIYKMFKNDPEALKIACLHVLTDLTVDKQTEQYLKFLKILLGLKNKN